MTENVSFLRLQARTQRFTLGAPKLFRVSPDGTRVLFVRSESGVDPRGSLWVIDLDTGVESKVADITALGDGEEGVPAEERARRERARERGAGIVGYEVDDQLRVAAFSVSGRLYAVDLASGETRRLVDGSVIDPRPNPTGTHIAYVRDRRLRVVDRTSGKDVELAADSGDAVSWGLAEFIAAEEMDRVRGYWWSPDGRTVLAARADSTRVPRWSIADPAHPEVPANAVAYPAAGSPNVDVSLSFLGLDGARVDVHRGQWEYLVAVHWSAGGLPLIAVQPRDQRELQVYVVDPADGSTTLLHTEADRDWVEIIPGVPAWTSDGRLAVIGARGSSYRLLIDGEPATGPQLQVRAVLHVGDEVLFSASDADPTQIHVYRTKAGRVVRLTEGAGVHTGSGSAAVTVVASWTLARSGPQVAVLRDGVPVASIRSNAVDPGLEPRPIMLTVGEHGLRVALLLPSGHQPGSKLPVLLDPYGGPQAQRVLASRNAFLTPQWMADQGFAVLIIDGRGTPGRGPRWEKQIARGTIAEVTLVDQIDALHAVAAEHADLDLSRVAIRGWSYGGFLAALAVLRRPDVFHAAAACAPVTDWALYDTHYTERYLGLPGEEPQTYHANSLIADAPSLRRPLLIVHGVADDNVFLAHALRLSAALLAAGKAHTFLPLVGETHVTPQDEAIAENLMMLQIDWIKQALGG